MIPVVDHYFVEANVVQFVSLLDLTPKIMSDSTVEVVTVTPLFDDVQ
jgi:hypothetical protein